MKRLIVLLAIAVLQIPATPPVGVTGLGSPAQIGRDARGIPYIEAGNEHDLYFAQGYVTAGDRLWQMDLLRRTARGELAEILGQAAVEGDKRHRILGFGRLVEELVPKLQPQVRASLEAYAEGVNAYIKNLDPSKLPLECRILQYSPQPWRAADSLLVGKIFAETLSTTWPTDLMRASMSTLPADVRRFLFPVTSPLDVLVVGSDGKTGRVDFDPAAQSIALQSASLPSVDPDSSHASNNWVISGKRTVTGKPLLANDPHLAPSAPSIWYMTHLSMPGLRVAGVTTPGAPGIILGHNERIGWGATNLEPDVQDLYMESAGSGETHREEIKVRNAATVTVDVSTTRHGPIILEAGGRRYALRWTALDPGSSELSALYFVNRARNWKEFREALRDYPGPTQNFVYADVDGHIGYYGAGKIPVRKSGDGSIPYDGSSGDGDWTRYIPFDELPQIFDPPSGVIVTANQRVVGSDYPYHLTHNWAHPNRARRIFDLLQAKPKLSVDDLQSVQADTYSIAGKTFYDEVSKMAPGLLLEWNGRSDADSRGALLVAMTRNAFRTRILSAVGGAELSRQYNWANDAFTDRIIVERPPVLLPKEFKDYSELVRASFKDAQETLRQTIGPNESDWMWGRFAQVRFPHPLASIPRVGEPFQIAPFPQKGGGAGPGATINAGAAVSMRLIADPSNWDQTRLGIALGESGDPNTPHWRDQLQSWQSVTPAVFPFSREAVKRSVISSVRLSPISAK
jgi:penicillin amidase